MYELVEIVKMINTETPRKFIAKLNVKIQVYNHIYEVAAE